MSSFEPISALSLQYINITWDGRLDGTAIDPTGQTAGETELTVQFAVPLSSGNPAEPAEPVTWYPAVWLLGGTGFGYVAQGFVGPPGEGGLVQLTAGLSYDVWGKLTGTPEIPVIYAGTQTVY